MGSSCSASSATVDGQVESHLNGEIETPSTPAQCCRLIPSSTAAVAHAIPHPVVSQIHRPDVAEFLPVEKRWCATMRGAQCCVTAVKVTCCRITVAVLEYAAQCPLVATLSLLGCCITPKAAHMIHSGFPSLTDLDLSHSRITDEVLAEVSNLTTLRSLRLHDVIPASLPLHLSRYEIYGYETEGLRDTAYNVSDSSIASFALLPSLEVLDLRQCFLDDAALLALTKIHSLKDLSIDIKELNLRNPGLPDFSSLEHLETVRVRFGRGEREVLTHYAYGR